MGKLNAKGGHSQLQCMRARLRKASCMNDDFDEDAGHLSEEPHPQPAMLPSTFEHAEQVVTTTAVPEPSSSSSSSPSSPTASTQTQDEQLQSGFFSRLPAEVRRMVYTELFSSANPLMKMHLHGSHDNAARLARTACRYVPAADYSTANDERDPMQTDPWPGWRGKNQPPRWFWHAWGLRLRWRVHWKCQAAAMMQWRARGDGTCEDLRGREGGWMGMFLCCRRMYAEAIECLFESTELIFTASEDAHRFFVQNPHCHTSKIRRLNFAFNHFKDHLFLQPIEAKHPRLASGGGGAPVGWDLWAPLMAAVRRSAPELRYLRVHLGPHELRGEQEELVSLLWEWERRRYGWVQEGADGVVYYEVRRYSLKEEEERMKGAEADGTEGDEAYVRRLGSAVVL